ncbi:hypothetical protein [Streptomyces sp. NPDC000229]|uniref:hypothetical protein n=1 Tax=Streptomyces sp. NPDC000229 TaxID=3154247 RepID=UPI003318DB37
MTDRVAPPGVDDRHRGATYVLTGPEVLTSAEQLAILGGAAGREVGAHTVTPEAWKASVARYVPTEFADALLGHWSTGAGCRGAGEAPAGRRGRRG